MEEFELYLDSEAFLLFQDKALREHACNAVEAFFEENEAVDKSQLYPIASVIQSGGFDGLSKLVRQQQEKNTKKKNKAFWSFLFNHIFNVTADKDSFNAFIRDEIRSFLQDEVSTGEDRKLRNKIKKDNKTKIKQAICKVLPIYFEHFNCHYFYHAAIH